MRGTGHMSDTMRRYLAITEEFGAEGFVHDDFGAAQPYAASPRVTTRVVAAVPGDDAPADYATESRRMALHLLAKIERHVRTTFPAVDGRATPLDPWIQDKLSQAAESLESVADYLSAAPLSEGTRRARSR